MKNYYIGDRKNRKISKAHLSSPDIKFCSLIVFLLLMLFTVLSI